jgi:hypothetical protein
LSATNHFSQGTSAALGATATTKQAGGAACRMIRGKEAAFPQRSMERLIKREKRKEVRGKAAVVPALWINLR